MRHITAMLLGSTAVLREGEGGGGGGGAGDQGFKAPDGMPAEFVGKDAGETLGKVWAGYGALNTRTEGLRGELARVPKAPEKPEGYTFKPSEKLAPFFGTDPAANPALTHARAAAHKAGIPDAAFASFIEGTYGPMIEAGLIAPPYDAKAEIQGYMKAQGVDQTTATAHFTEAETFAKGLAGQLKGIPPNLQKDAQAALVALTDTAGGNALLRALSSRLSESGFRLDGSSGGQQGELTDSDLDKLTSDPRIDPRNEFATDPNQRYDPQLRKRYDMGMSRRGREKYAGKQ
jgi:hypothetical protein